MSALLRLNDGSLVPLASVGRIEPPDRERLRIVRDLNGHTIGKVRESALDELRALSLPVIPAPHGWLLITYADSDDSDFWTSTEPLLGWALDWSYPLPITPSPDENTALAAIEKLWREARSHPAKETNTEREA